MTSGDALTGRERTRAQLRRAGRLLLVVLLAGFSVLWTCVCVGLLVRGEWGQILDVILGLLGLFLSYRLLMKPAPAWRLAARPPKPPKTTWVPPASPGPDLWRGSPVALYSICTTLLVLLLYVGVRAHLEWEHEPKAWGTFTTQEYTCSGQSDSCHDVGTWVSDDGSESLEGLTLEKSFPVGRVVRAYVQRETSSAIHEVHMAGDDSEAGLFWKLGGAAAVILTIMGSSFIIWRREERSADGIRLHA